MRAPYPAPVDHRSSDAEVFAAARRVEPLYARIMGDSWFQLGGERITHAVMGILYGAMIASLVPVLMTWGSSPTGLVAQPAGVPAALRWGSCSWRLACSPQG